MHNFPPVLSECILWCQLRYNSLKAHNILAFAPIVLTPVSFSFLSGSLDGINYTIKFPKKIQTILWCMQETSLPTKQSPCRGAHDRAEDEEGDGTADPLQGVNHLCLAGPERPRIRVPEVEWTLRKLLSPQPGLFSEEGNFTRAPHMASCTLNGIT